MLGFSLSFSGKSTQKPSQKYRIQTTGLGKSAGNPGILNVSSICWGWRLPPLRWCDTPQVDGVKFGMHRQGPLMDHKETARAPGVSRGLGGWALGKSISVNWSGFSQHHPRMVGEWLWCVHIDILIYSVILEYNLWHFSIFNYFQRFRSHLNFP